MQTYPGGEDGLFYWVRAEPESPPPFVPWWANPSMTPRRQQSEWRLRAARSSAATQWAG